jgi:hypothetical protein
VIALTGEAHMGSGASGGTAASLRVEVVTNFLSQVVYTRPAVDVICSLGVVSGRASVCVTSMVSLTSCREVPWAGRGGLTIDSAKLGAVGS